MGGACPSRAPPTHVVEGLRAPPHPLVGGWYQDGGNWLHVEVRVVITDAIDGGLSGSGTMPAADVMVVHFDHRPHRQVQGRIQANGDIEWDNGKAWVKYEGAGQDHGGSASGSAPHLPISPGSASESMSPRSRDSNAMDFGAASSGPGASQPGSTSKAAPLGAASPSPGDSQPRITSRDAPAVLRVVHPRELQNCSCECPARPLLWVPEEEKPRCYECAKPVQELARLEPLDRAAARWRLFYHMGEWQGMVQVRRTAAGSRWVGVGQCFSLAMSPRSFFWSWRFSAWVNFECCASWRRFSQSWRSSCCLQQL